MGCKECSKVQDLAFDKSIAETTPIAYIRIDIGNVAIVGCKKHLKMLIDKLKGDKK